MKKLTTLVLTSILLMGSCINPDHYAPAPVEKTVIVVTEQRQPLPNNTEIPLFFKKEQSVPEYNKVAHIEVVGNEWFSEDQLINNLKYEAHKLGANALVNVEFGEDIFNVEKSRILADTLYDAKEMRVKRKTKLRQFMRGLAVVMDSTALPVANDSIASHIEYIKEERIENWQKLKEVIIAL